MPIVFLLRDDNLSESYPDFYRDASHLWVGGVGRMVWSAPHPRWRLSCSTSCQPSKLPCANSLFVCFTFGCGTQGDGSARVAERVSCMTRATLRTASGSCHVRRAADWALLI